MNREERIVREWINKFKQGDFDHNDWDTQVEAGWYDWFCKDTSLANKTKRMGSIIKQIKPGGRIDFDNMYVWFKNNCPINGPLYDDFRFADRATRNVMYNVAIESPHYDRRYTVFGRENHFKEPLFESNSSKELIAWLSGESKKLVDYDKRI
jgi:hypothetical protein